MKKTLAMMSVLLLAGTLLSGCGKKAVEETTAVPADTQGTTRQRQRQRQLQPTLEEKR